MTPDDVLKALYDETLVGNAPAVLEWTAKGLEMGMAPEEISGRVGINPVQHSPSFSLSISPPRLWCWQEISGP